MPCTAAQTARGLGSLFQLHVLLHHSAVFPPKSDSRTWSGAPALPGTAVGEPPPLSCSRSSAPCPLSAPGRGCGQLRGEAPPRPPGRLQRSPEDAGERDFEVTKRRRGLSLEELPGSASPRASCPASWKVTAQPWRAPGDPSPFSPAQSWKFYFHLIFQIALWGVSLRTPKHGPKDRLSPYFSGQTGTRPRQMGLFLSFWRKVSGLTEGQRGGRVRTGELRATSATLRQRGLMVPPLLTEAPICTGGLRLPHIQGPQGPQGLINPV